MPLYENGISYVDRPKSLSYFRYILAGCLLCILVVSLLVNIMFTMSRVKTLEEEVDILKKALVKIRILDEDIMGQIIGFDSDDNVSV